MVYFCGQKASFLGNEGFRVFYLDLSAKSYKIFNPWPVIKLASLLRHKKPFIVHVQRHRPLVYTALALRLLRLKIPLIYTIRLSRLVRTRSRRLALRFVEKQITRVVAVSRGVAEDFVRRSGFPRKKVIIIPNGINPGDYDAPISQKEARRIFSLPEGFLFGMVARLRKAKDHEGLLEAFSRVLPHMPKAFLVLVGDGPREAFLRSKVLQLGFNKRVIFLGRLAPEKVPQVLKAFDVFVHPTFREGMPAAVLEAMAARLPIIATDAEGIEDIFDTPRCFGRLVARGDREALAKALLELYSLPEKERKRLGEEARLRLEEEFTRENMVQRNVELYCSLLGENSLLAKRF